MPHILIEFSANVETALEPQRLVNAVHDAAVETGLFRISTVRTRAARREHYAVADKNPVNGFIAVTMRISPGRDLAVRSRVASDVLAAITALGTDTIVGQKLAISVDIEEVDASVAARKNNLVC
jgi:5-carboxymethyl-2-hydroxymuconate isomerase